MNAFDGPQTTGTPIQAGGLYAVFSGDSERPYLIVKVLNEEPDGSLRIKGFFRNEREMPGGLTQDIVADGYQITTVSTAMFRAWGPPEFPIRVGTQDVTADELAEPSR